MNDATDLQNSFDFVKKLLPHLGACISILDEHKEKLRPSEESPIDCFQKSLKDIASGFSELQRYVALVRNDFFSDEEGINKEFTSTVLESIHTFNNYFVGCLDSTLSEFKDNVQYGLFYSLKTLHLHKPSRKVVEKVVEICPDALYTPYEDEDEQSVICYAAEHAGADPSYVKMLISIAAPFLCQDAYYDPTMLELLITPDESDGANADRNRVIALQDLKEMGFLKKKHIRSELSLKYCDCVRLPKVFDFLCSCDPYALLLNFWKDKPFESFDSLWDVSKVALYLEAGFKYWPEIGGLLFLKNTKGTSVLDDAFEIYGETKIMKILQTILSKRCDFPILHHVFVKSPKHKDLFHRQFPWATCLRDHSGRTVYQSILASGTAEMKAAFSDMVLCVADIQLQEKDPVTTLHPFAAVTENLDLCFKLLRHNPSVLNEESRHVVSLKKRKRLTFLDKNYEDSLSGSALKLYVQYLDPVDVLSCAQTCKEWNASIDNDVWVGIARRINPMSCNVMENLGMGNITYKALALAFVRKEVPLWKVPERPRPLKTEDVIVVVEIRQGWYGKRNLVGSYSCLLSNLHGAKNMKLHFCNSSETGAHIVIPAYEIEHVLGDINSSRKDPRSNFIPMHAFRRLEFKIFLMQKSTGRSMVLHDFAHFKEEFSGQTMKDKRFSQSVNYLSGIPRTHEEIVKRDKNIHDGKRYFSQSLGLTLAIVPQPENGADNLEPPGTAKQLRKEISKLQRPLEYMIVKDSIEMEFSGFDNVEELLSFLRRLPWQ